MSAASKPVRVNPFRPGSIVTPGMFVGRMDEIERLEQVLAQTSARNATNFLIQGERGIGKSSLLVYLRDFATREVVIPGSRTFNFLVVQLECEQGDTQAALIIRLGEELRRCSARHQKLKHFLEGGWDFLKRWEVAGVKYSEASTKETPGELIRQLADTIASTEQSLPEGFDGILFLVDEADKAPATAHLGSTLKLLVERLAKLGVERASFGLFGLPTVVQHLRESHASAPRLFEVFTLEPLLPSEREWVLKRGLTISKEKSGVITEVDPKASKLISELSEGYPHFVQQFCYSAFDADTDFTISVEDVYSGALKENGAFHQLGVKYFEDLYFDQIRSDDYRAVLRAMSARGDGWISKAEIREASQLKETTLTNAITALKKRHIILPKDGVQGVYRLPNRAFAAWIGAYTAADPDQGMVQNDNASR